MLVMIVYADILFCLNFIVTYFLLMLTARLAHTHVRLLRLIIGAATGGLTSFTMLLPLENEIALTVIKLWAASVIVFFCFGYKNLKVFLRHTLLFFGATFVYAGIMLAIWFAFKPQNMVIEGSTVYFGISPMVLIVSSVAAHLIITVIRKFSARRTEPADVYRLAVVLDNTECGLRALLDTGNALCDILSDAPIIVASYAAVKDLLPTDARFSYEHQLPDCPDSMFGKFRVVPYSSVGGEGLLPGFKADSVQVYMPDGRKLFCQNAIVAVAKSPLSGDYNALIGRDLFNKSEGVKSHAAHAVHR